MASTSLSIEPVMLGQGKTNGVINLDAGARDGASTPYFSRGGFVSPKTPQPMVLSSHILIYQSQKLRDECQELRQESGELLNQTRMLAEEVRDLEASAGQYAAGSQASASESQAFAEQANRSLQETESIYNEVTVSARKMDTLAKRAAYAQGLESIKAPSAGILPGDQPGLESRITALEERIGLLEQKIAELEAVLRFNMLLD